MTLNEILKDETLSQKEKEKLLLEAERSLCKTDLFYLAKKVLGYKDLSEKYHRPIADALTKYKKDWQFHLHPRGHFKSTLITVAETIQDLLINPNETILITNAVLANAASFLKELKSHFLHNERFKRLFPEYIPRSAAEEGNSESFTVPCRTERWIREASVEISGIDKSVVSRHYGIIKFDDVVNNLNVSTPEQRAKIITSFKEYLSLLNPGGRIRVIGTRWHYHDLYGYIKDEIDDYKRAKEKSPFIMFITRCYKDDGTPAFPEKFSQEILDNLKKIQGAHIFSCQYLNDPQPDEEKVFNRTDIKLVTESFKEPGTEYFRFCSTDPSVSNSENSDPSVVITVAVNANKQIFIENISRQWVNPDQFINLCLETAKNVKPLKFGIETTAFQRTLKFFLEKEARLRGVRIPIIEISRSSKISKNERIKRLQPYLKAGQVFLVADENNLKDEHLALFDELDEFPYSKHDDILDALSDVLELIIYPSKRIKRELQFESFQDGPYRTGYRFKTTDFSRRDRYS